MPEHADTLRRLYESNARELYAYALSLTGHVHTAEDAVHGAMARVLARWCPPREMRPYLFRCVRNAALDAARRNGVAARNAHFLVPLDALDQRNAIACRDEAEHLLSLLADDERECVVLKIYAGLTFAEIARMRGVSINTAASWYRRGLARMHAAAQEDHS